MKRFISALVFCSLFLVLLSLFLFPPVAAKENPLLTLLNLPAPAPPNPKSSGFRNRDQTFYSKSNLPKDDAPMAELLDYWNHQSNSDQKLQYSPEPSAVVRERLMREIRKNPKLLPNYLNIFKRDDRAIDLVKEIYDRESLGGVFEKEEPSDADPEGLMLIDPATGTLIPAAGEFRPLDQQTFRPLQKSLLPFQFWAARPGGEKNETQVGIYDTRTFTFKLVQRVPKIRFNSMNMWVDEGENKLYFVYRGHLLACRCESR